MESSKNYKIIFIPLSYDGYMINSGSERIRCKWLTPYLNADIYSGQDLEDYDVIIYQKCYLKARELVRKHQDKIQIFDVCDPIWLGETSKEFHEMAKLCNLITTSTQELTHELIKLGYESYPILDKIDFNYFKGIKKVHEDKPIWLTWFGYADRFDEVRKLIPYIEENHIPLLIIADKPVGYGRFVQWNEQTWLKDIIKGDIVLNPQREFKTHIYTNKSLTAWALGMPVAENEIDIQGFSFIGHRQSEVDRRFEEVKRDWDISQSAEQLIGLIKQYEISKN